MIFGFLDVSMGPKSIIFNFGKIILINIMLGNPTCWKTEKAVAEHPDEWFNQFSNLKY